jgi:hypothetical protein
MLLRCRRYLPSWSTEFVDPVSLWEQCAHDVLHDAGTGRAAFTTLDRYARCPQGMSIRRVSQDRLPALHWVARAATRSVYSLAKIAGAWNYAFKLSTLRVTFIQDMPFDRPTDLLRVTFIQDMPFDRPTDLLIKNGKTNLGCRVRRKTVRSEGLGTYVRSYVSLT